METYESEVRFTRNYYQKNKDKWLREEFFKSFLRTIWTNTMYFSESFLNTPDDFNNPLFPSAFRMQELGFVFCPAVSTHGAVAPYYYKSYKYIILYYIIHYIILYYLLTSASDCSRLS